MRPGFFRHRGSRPFIPEASHNARSKTHQFPDYRTRPWRSRACAREHRDRARSKSLGTSSDLAQRSRASCRAAGRSRHPGYSPRSRSRSKSGRTLASDRRVNSLPERSTPGCAAKFSVSCKHCGTAGGKASECASGRIGNTRRRETRPMALDARPLDGSFRRPACLRESVRRGFFDS